MSDVFGEARIRIVPDLSGFSERLNAELNAATQAAAGQQRLAGASASAVRGSKNLADQSKSTTRELLGASSASARLDSALLGLRTAAGSTAVIGLGAMSLAAIVAGKALRGMLVATAEFEQELSTFQATTGATAEQMEAVSDAARRLGADIKLPAVSAADAAVAMTELAKAGLSVQDAIAGSEGVLQLATAAQISNAEAAQIAANSLNAFGLAGDQAVRVADVLANASNAAQGSIVDFGQALAQSEAVARQVGLSLEDTTAILSLFAKNGLQGSDAGTSLRVALIRLVAPTEKAAAEIRKLGLNIRDAQGNLRADVFAQFGEATRDLSPAARDAAAALIFGQDAIRAVSIGAREGTAGLRLMRFEMDQSGTAAELAGARTQGLAGAMESLKSSLETIGINIGPLLAGPLEEFAKSLGTLASEIGAVTGKLHDLGQIKIPPISIDVGFKVHLPEGRLGSILSKALGIGGLAAVSPLGAAAVFGKQLFDSFKDAPEAARKLKVLQDQLQDYQKARVAAEKGGQTAIADRLTARIDKTKQRIDALKASVQGFDVGTAATQQIQDLTRAIELLQGTPGNAQNIRDLQLAVDNLKAGFQASGAPVRDFTTDLGHLGTQADSTASALARATSQTKALKDSAITASDQLQKLQAEGASPQTQIAKLREANVAQKAIIANAEIGGRQSGDISDIRRARAAIIANNAQIESLQGQIASANKQATDNAKKRADDAAAEADKQTQAFIEQFGAGRQKRLNQAKLDAALTEGIQDDINVERKIKRFLQAKIAAVRERIRNLHLHGAALKTAQAAIRAALDEINDINNQIAQDIQTRSEQRLTSIELDIDLAQTTGNVRREISLRRKLIAALREAQRHVARSSLEYKRLRNRIAEETQAIKDLQKEKKEQNNTAASAAFEFLQSQQGFAANLLGNLVPLGSLGNTVGGTATPPPQALATGITPHAAIQQQAVSKAAQAQGGFTASQSTTVVELLGEMVRELKAIRNGNAHPEARYHKPSTAAAHKPGVHR